MRIDALRNEKKQDPDVVLPFRGRGREGERIDEGTDGELDGVLKSERPLCAAQVARTLAISMSRCRSSTTTEKPAAWRHPSVCA